MCLFPKNTVKETSLGVYTKIYSDISHLYVQVFFNDFPVTKNLDQKSPLAKVAMQQRTLYNNLC